jgi:Tol biopolymer transport system component
LYLATDPKTAIDLWVLSMTGDRKPFLFLKTPYTEVLGEVSPDGRWVTYQSNESSQFEIYVQPFIAPGAVSRKIDSGAVEGRWQVSTEGGLFPAWRPDGKELYYLNPAGGMMAAPITVTGSTVQVGAPKLLFQTRISGGGVDAAQGRQYDIAQDGQFLINTEIDTGVTAPITLIQNWNPDAGK